MIALFGVLPPSKVQKVPDNFTHTHTWTSPILDQHELLLMGEEPEISLR